MDFPSLKDLQLLARDELLTRNPKLTAEAVDTPGTDIFAIVSAIAAVGDELAGSQARLQAALLLSAARGKDLTRLAFDRYGVIRRAAAPALGSVVFGLPVAAVGSFTIPARTLLQAAGGTQFITTENVVFLAGTTSSPPVAVRAAVAGLSTQVLAAAITNIIAAPPSAPTGLTCTNPYATAGAADEEQDDSLRARALSFFSTARRGTVLAIRDGALAHAGVETATVFEALDGLGRPARTLQLFITDQYTESLAQLSAVPAAYAVQSQVLSASVFLALDEYRAAGIFVDVSVAKVILQSVSLALNFKAGTNADQVALRARVAVLNYINSLSPGDPFIVSEAIDALRIVPGLLVTGSEILSPSGTITPMPLEVLRTSLGIVVASTLQPDRRLASTTNPDAA